jgi:hypothetical protein
MAGDKLKCTIRSRKTTGEDFSRGVAYENYDCRIFIFSDFFLSQFSTGSFKRERLRQMPYRRGDAKIPVQAAQN